MVVQEPTTQILVAIWIWI